jgi:hypothetical protein
MLDQELAQLQTWRYCNVVSGDKKPYPNNWQHTPLTLQQVVSTNIGVILGKYSNGLCSIDFDGEQAIDHWTNTFGIDIASLDTVMWTSGKPYRLQAAFTVDSEYWDVLKRKVINSLEFRWNCQSVLPPSTLNDGREYFWINSPKDYVVQRLPEDVLVYWLNMIKDEYVAPTHVTEYEKNTPDEIAELCQELKRLYPTLDYDTWIRVTWAFCNELGTGDGIMLMRYHYPEEKRGEYNKLIRNGYSGRPVTIGTVIKMIKDRSGNLPRKHESTKSLIKQFNRG